MDASSLSLCAAAYNTLSQFFCRLRKRVINLKQPAQRTVAESNAFYIVASQFWAETAILFLTLMFLEWRGEQTNYDEHKRQRKANYSLPNKEPKVLVDEVLTAICQPQG